MTWVLIANCLFPFASVPIKAASEDLAIMGLWGVLWEIVKAVGPHAAPHVARAMTQRKSTAESDRRTHAAVKEIAQEFSTLEERVQAAEERAGAAERNSIAAEERAASAEEKLALAQAQMADQWAAARKWFIALLAWNALMAAALLFLLFRHR
jgi:septal ring factor EnvC (AmiA/AmiB activator)